MAEARRKLKVLHVLNSNARNRYLESIARHIDREKYQIVIGGMDARGPLNDALDAMGVESFHLDAPGARSPRNLLALVRLFRRLRPDVVHAHTFWVSLAATAAARAARVPKVFVTRHHAAIHLNLHKPWHIRLERQMTRLTTRTVAVSDYVKDIMIRREGHPAAKVVRVHNAIDPLPLTGSLDRARLLAQLGLDPGDLVGITIGRVHPEKNLDVLVTAAGLLPPKVRFLLVGPEDPAYRARLDKQLAEGGTADRFRFLGIRQDVGDLLKSVDFLVHPSQDESFGFVTLEALSLGTPVIASDIPAAREVLTEECAAFFPAQSSAALAARIGELLADPAPFRARAQRGLARVAERFTFPRLMREYEALYDLPA